MEIIIIIKVTFDLLTILVEVDLSAINNFWPLTKLRRYQHSTNFLYIDVMVSAKIF